MNSLTLETALVNPATLDATLEDAEYDAWLDANADRMAEESEALGRVENGWLL